MKKKMLATVGLMSLVLSMSTIAFAAQIRNTNYRNTTTTTNRGCTNMSASAYMRDADGNLLSLEAYTAQLDAAVKAGTITSEDRTFYLDRYAYCVENGTGFGGGGCRGARNFN